MGLNREDVQQHFRAQVTSYDALMMRLIPQYAAQRDILLSLVPARHDNPLRVLDLGCGTGATAERLLAEYPRATVNMLDLTSEMIEVARARVGDDRATYQIGDFRGIDLGSDYDVILASLSLHHATLAERPAMAERLFASLAPGGRLLTAEVIVDAAPDVRAHQYALWREFMRSAGEDGDDWYEKHLRKDHPIEPSAWVQCLRDAGFQRAGCYWRYLNFAVFAADRAA